MSQVSLNGDLKEAGIKPMGKEELKDAAEESYSAQLLKNPDFDSDEYWYNESEGDTSDVNGSLDNNQANFMILGDRNETIVDNETYSFHPDNWKVIENADNMSKPDNWDITSEGLWTNHSWDEDENQSAKVQWACNISTPINMSDYEISSVNLEAWVNATVDANIDIPGESSQSATFDYIRFFILVSDLERKKTNEIAYNQTRYLGDDDAPGDTDTMPDTKLTNIPSSRIKDYISEALSYDGFNFTLTIGVRYWCEDNRAKDNDTWNDILIKNVSLEISFEKKIDQFTSHSWNQQISDINSLKTNVNDSLEIDKCYLKYDYNISELWSNFSQNSEIQILLNGISFAKTIKLTEVNTSISSEQFDITKIISNIPFDENIKISIRLFLADNFELNRTVVITIDNIYLDIYYTLNFEDYESNLNLFLDGVNKTKDPSKELITGEKMNITAKYFDYKGNHLAGSTIQLKFSGRTYNLIENETSSQYSLLINDSNIFDYGTNVILLEAKAENYQRKIINLKIIHRRIRINVTSNLEEPQISIKPGDNVNFSIKLENTDYGGLVKNAIVTYEWEEGAGVLEDLDNDGYYEGFIEKIPEGTYKIRINAIISDEYEIEDYEITVTAFKEQLPDLTWLIYTLIGGISVISGYFVLYQKYLKYPPLVRKLRKLRKKINKEKKLKPLDIKNRDKNTEKILKNKFKPLKTEKSELNKNYAEMKKLRESKTEIGGEKNEN